YTQATWGTPERRNGAVPSARAIAQEFQAALVPSSSVEWDGNLTHRYSAVVVSVAAVGSPSSIGSDGSRDHSFQEPKYIRTSFTPAFFSARNVFEARAPFKQYR